MASYLFTRANPSFVSYDGAGNIKSIFWEWNYGNTGAVIGDIVQADFDLNNLLDGANEKIVHMPAFAYLHTRMSGNPANDRRIIDSSGFPLPTTGTGAVNGATDNAASSYRGLSAIITADRVAFRISLNADSTPGDFMRFGFLFDF